MKKVKLEEMQAGQYYIIDDTPNQKDAFKFLVLCLGRNSRDASEVLMKDIDMLLSDGETGMSEEWGVKVEEDGSYNIIHIDSEENPEYFL